MSNQGNKKKVYNIYSGRIDNGKKSVLEACIWDIVNALELFVHGNHTWNLWLQKWMNFLFSIINTKLVSLFWLLLLISHFSETAEENCVEENHAEPDHSDDSVRVKIADLGNACWVVSHVNWPGKQPLILDPPLISPSLFQTFSLWEHPKRCEQDKRFTTVSLLVKFATFEFATYIFVLLPNGKVQNLHPRRNKLKRTRNIIKRFFSRAIKGIFSMVYRK